MTVARKPRETAVGKSDVGLAAMGLAVEAGPAEIYASNSATTTVGVRRKGLETHEEDQVLIQGVAAAGQEVRQEVGYEGVQPAAGRGEGGDVESQLLVPGLLCGAALRQQGGGKTPVFWGKEIFYFLLWIPLRIPSRILLRIPLRITLRIPLWIPLVAVCWVMVVRQGAGRERVPPAAGRSEGREGHRHRGGAHTWC